MTTSEDDPASIGVVVAHPDDETLWAGGTILMHPRWRWRIFTLCRAGDSDRSPRFDYALARFGASGRMADLDDGPEQAPLDHAVVERTVLDLLGDSPFDVLMTHGPRGEYTWHRRHVETFDAVAALWCEGALHAHELWLFAYDDGGKSHLPRAAQNPDITTTLPQDVWHEKYRILHEIYGFDDDTWEAQTTPKTEAFWRLTSPDELAAWMRRTEQ
jgi:LmbE family N-acetylglucosaminyl deacetylase